MEYNNKTYKNYEDFKPQLESIGRYGYFFITAMVMIIAWGIYALYTQLSKGQVVTGMRDYVIWGIYDANFIFFIGIIISIIKIFRKFIKSFTIFIFPF